MGKEQLKVGIVGVGGIARNYHIPSYQRSGNVEIAAICDVSEAALKQVEDKHEIENCYLDYHAMLQEETLDIVSICTSNDMHYPIAMEAMRQGVDVFCEKPLALRYAQAKEMYQTARDAGIKTGVNFSHRRTPAAQLANEIIKSGALEEIYYVAAVYAAGSTEYAKRPWTWRNDRARAEFGGLGDMGSHIIDMILWWLECDVEAVAANMQTFVPERTSAQTGEPMPVTTEDQGMLLVDYSNGAMGYICGSYTFTGRGFDQRVEVYGSEGGLMYDQQHPYELQVHLPSEILDEYVILREGGTRDRPYTTILVPERLQGIVKDGGARRTVLMDYLDAYRSGDPFSFSPGFYEGMRVQEILEASRGAASSRRWVKLPL
ncbi:MAG: Gfo/Idh/MocA family oxidoreductase [Chloroflexota bacterium]|nr:Gfo/Idh/MocA family oxidoreductase [Chloroflexota bacterium]